MLRLSIAASSLYKANFCSRHAKEIKMNLFCDSKMDDARRRAELYRGSIFVYSASPSGQRFAAFARGLIEASFSGLDPERAQEHMPVEKCVEVLAGLKPR